ncbi:efflux RND transporter periplasmic adaptor subunit [Nodosilinea sp. P-1105]|uniref:efflux RND transporter periplasmic adaptor subunit n=1 Tax=Nodosilinea sp. P-1105 TaxID=2546229 RepID=UPI00197F146C
MAQPLVKVQQVARFWSGYALIGVVALTGVACGQSPQLSAQAQPAGPGEQDNGTPVVDVAIAEVSDAGARVYTGTTRPARQVSLRSQAEGRLLSLTGDPGDTVQQGQVLGRLDNVLLQTAVGEAEAELAARQFEVARAEAELADIRTSIEQARVELQQASNDAQRLKSLADQGAIAAQEAERADTTQRTAEQALASAQEQVRTRQQSVSAAQQRVAAQRSIVQETQQRLTFANLSSPISGVVLERVTEPGDLVQPGETVLTLGDLAEIRVVIDVTDSQLQSFALGQPIDLEIDAFPGETFNGRVTRISPVADGTSRQVPVEITVPNPGSRIGSGLLARVRGGGTGEAVVLVPESALETSENGEDQVFVITESEDGTAVVEARTVQISDRADGEVSIRLGLSPGEQYVVRSNQPLESGQTVQLSLMSDG